MVSTTTRANASTTTIPFAALFSWLLWLLEHFLAAISSITTAKFWRRKQVYITSFPLLELPQDVVLQVMGFLASSNVAARSTELCETHIKETTKRLLLHRALLSNVCKAWHAQLQAEDASDNSWLRTLFIGPPPARKEVARRKSSNAFSSLSSVTSIWNDSDDESEDGDEDNQMDICVTWLLTALPSLVHAARRPKEEICDALKIIINGATRRHSLPRIDDGDDEPEGDSKKVSVDINQICCFMWACLTSPSLRRDGTHAAKVVGVWESLLKSKLPAARSVMSSLSIRLFGFLLQAVQATGEDRKAFYHIPSPTERAAETHDPHLFIWGTNPHTLRKLCAGLLELAAAELGPGIVSEWTLLTIQSRITDTRGEVEKREAGLLALGALAASCGEKLAPRRKEVLGKWIAPCLEDWDEMTRCTAFWTLGRVLEGMFDTGALDEGVRRQVFEQVLPWFEMGLSDRSNKVVMAASNALGESFEALDFPLSLQFKAPSLTMTLRAIRRKPRSPGPYAFLNKLVEMVGWAMWERSGGKDLRLVMETVVGAWRGIGGYTQKYPVETIVALWREVMLTMGGKEGRQVTILTGVPEEGVGAARTTTTAAGRRVAKRTKRDKKHGSTDGESNSTTSSTTSSTISSSSSITTTMSVNKHQATLLEGPWIPRILALARQALQSNLCLSTPLRTELVAACLNLICAFLELIGDDAKTLFQVHAPWLVDECLLPLLFLSRSVLLPGSVSTPLHALLGEAIALNPSPFTSCMRCWVPGLVRTITDKPLTPWMHLHGGLGGESPASEPLSFPSSSPSSSSMELPGWSPGNPHPRNIINNAVYAFGQLALVTYTPPSLPSSSSSSSSPLIPYLPPVIKALGRVLKTKPLPKRQRREEEGENEGEEEDEEEEEDDPMALLELLSGGRRDEEMYLRVTCACTLGALALHSPAMVHEWLLASWERQETRRAQRREGGGGGQRRRRWQDEEERGEEEDLVSRWCGLLVEGPKVLRGNLNRAELGYGLAGLTMVLAHDIEKGGLALLSLPSSFPSSSSLSPTGAGEGKEGRLGGAGLFVLWTKALAFLEGNIPETDCPAFFPSLSPTLTRDTAQRLLATLQSQHPAAYGSLLGRVDETDEKRLCKVGIIC